MKKLILNLVLAAGFGAAAFAQETKPVVKALYECGFEKAEVGKVPEDMMVLDGAWAVKAEGGNKVLELPGAPLENFGVLFGPTGKGGLAVTARVFATNNGRRQPVFGIGLGGVGGFKFLVAPAKRVLEIWKGDDLLASSPCQWESGVWARLRLQIRKIKDGEWKIEAKTWKDGVAEPQGWTIAHSESAEPPAGRAAAWGMPLSGTPIWFDDFKVTAVEK